MRFKISLMLVGALIINSGCQPIAAPVERTTPPASLSPAQTASPIPPSLSTPKGEALMTPSLPASSGIQPLIDMAVNDLSRRLSIPAEEITLLEVAPVVWPDASLGCPQPGMAYAQVMVDGLLIRLQAGGAVYEYHSGGRRDPFLCEKKGKEPTPPPLIDLFNLTPSPPEENPTSPAPDNSIPPGGDQ